jgi:hypothetical protein
MMARTPSLKASKRDLVMFSAILFIEYKLNKKMAEVTPRSALASRTLLLPGFLAG